MESSIYGLKGEFKYQNEQAIVFYEKNGEELTMEDFNDVQLKMIQSNRIPHLLPLTVENIDLSAKLYYNIQSKSKVISFFRSNRTTMNDYYQFFLSIVKALEESSSYMLSQEQYVLHTDYIFVGRNASDVYLVYVPISDLDRETSAEEDLKELLTDIAGEVEGLQGNEFKSVLSYIRSHAFSLSGLKKLLVDLMSVRSNVNEQVNNYGGAMPGSGPQYGNTLAAPQENRDNSNNNSGSSGLQGPQKQNKQQKVVPGSENNEVKEKKVLPALTSREAVYLIAAVLLGIGITWKLYDMFPNLVTLIVSIALSLAMLAAGFVYWKVWRPGVEPETKTVSADPSKAKENASSSKSVSQQPQQAKTKQPANAPQQPMQESSTNVTKQAQVNQEPEPNMTGQMQVNQGPAPNMDQQYPVNQQQQQEVPLQQPMHQGSVPQPPYEHQPQPEGVANQFAQTNPHLGSDFAAATRAPFESENADDTVLLDDEDMPNDVVGNETNRMPYLIRTAEDGSSNTIQVDQAKFLIGRNDESVHYADKTLGVSRLHAEIIRIDATSYGVKDLGAKNGSKLNGNAMVPYKMYALHEEDVLSLGKATYTFSWSVNQ